MPKVESHQLYYNNIQRTVSQKICITRYNHYLRSPDFHGLYENKQLGKYDLSAINSSWNYEGAASLIILAQPQRILFA